MNSKIVVFTVSFLSTMYVLGNYNQKKQKAREHHGRTCDTDTEHHRNDHQRNDSQQQVTEERQFTNHTTPRAEPYCPKKCVIL